MNNTKRIDSHRPAVIRLIQMLMYLAAFVNIINGIYSINSLDFLKKWLCIAMIVVGLAAAYVGFLLNSPSATSRTAVITLSVAMIGLRLIEFAVWQNVGFIIGVILPVLVIWKLRSQESKTWFKGRST
ncbi:MULTISPECIES: hypothetical protein [Paenibacillus]|uniref:hypothetical protein n=1 Tax=Paenibacillus TaxID=44249 RepID=UPI001FFF9852|nr:hypothetical protein [Paenibacillus pabuli]UPK41310.1 hypothetical protein KET34_18665 [Paenibacillus pabuli]